MINPAGTIDATTITKMQDRLTRLYADDAEVVLAKLLAVVDRHQPTLPTSSLTKCDERDVVLITYGDQVRAAGQHPLMTLNEFLTAHEIDKLIRTVHILPFCPYSSDDGFSVIDYRTVDPDLGDWHDIQQLGKNFELMFDLVLNHISRHSHWFEEYVAGHEPFIRYFIETDPTTDLSKVTRPRSLPLLTQVETIRGKRHVWTTFSEDQIDLNYANPEVLIEMVDVFLSYVQHGARIIRLDAIAYLWKQIGTSCIHLSQTHEIVKLLRDLIDAVAPHALLLTETNVPHAENISYFGDGDEAHMVYQFSLPPLLLDALLSQDARPLMTWLAGLDRTPPGTTFFNFTASHDGVGVRPLEGLVSSERLSQLVDAVRTRQGLVSTRRQPDGSDTPYELNISYVSALADRTGDTELQARRFLTSQGIMLSLPGVPAVYFHSLVGTENDDEGVRQSGQPRRINRRKYQLTELEAIVADTKSLSGRIFTGYQHLLSVRIRQPAFHPDAATEVWRVDEPWLVALVRTSIDHSQQLLVLANLSDQQQQVDLTKYTQTPFPRDVLSDRDRNLSALQLEPFELMWLDRC